MLTFVQGANAALSFLLEIAVLVAACFWGFTHTGSIFLRVAAGLGAPVALAVVWFFFGAPGATFALSGAGRVVLEVLWFGAGAVFLVAAGKRRLAAVFVGLYLVNTVLRIIWHQ
jgi:hypothetical protein